MAHRIKMDITSLSSIQQAKKELEQYRDNLKNKSREFVKRLSVKGVVVARENSGVFGSYLIFSQRTQRTVDGYRCVLYATETGKVTREWKSIDDNGNPIIKTVDISPLLMTEFGSGFKAENPKNVPDVGQGTFPDQKHAFDKNGWYYQTLDGVWHHSYGFEPTQPMLKAYNEMFNTIFETAREVFGG